MQHRDEAEAVGSFGRWVDATKAKMGEVPLTGRGEDGEGTATKGGGPENGYGAWG